MIKRAPVAEEPSNPSRTLKGRYDAHREELLNEEKTSPVLHIKATKCIHSKIKKERKRYVFYIGKLLITTWVIYPHQIFAQICGNLNVLGQIIMF